MTFTFSVRRLIVPTAVPPARILRPPEVIPTRRTLLTMKARTFWGESLANAMMRAYCERDDRLAFIDFDTLMLGWDEKPRRELFVEDGLHLTAQGYQLWSTVLRPWLTAP